MKAAIGDGFAEPCRSRSMAVKLAASSTMRRAIGVGDAARCRRVDKPRRHRPIAPEPGLLQNTEIE